MTTTYMVTKVTYSYRFCNTCGGKGKKQRTFQGHKFTDPCIMCKGTGREKITQKTEVPLMEALKELQLIKQS